MSIITTSNIVMMIAYVCILILDIILFNLEIHRRGFIVGWKNIPVYEQFQFIAFCIFVGIFPFFNVALAIFIFLAMGGIVDKATKP